MEKITIICTALSMVISFAAFAHGAVKLFKKGKPLYCQIIMWAVGCYCLQCIESCVVYFCGDFSDKGIIGQIAMCGFFFALFSANFNTLDDVVDDRKQNNGRYRKLALIAPLAYGTASVVGVLHIFPLYNYSFCSLCFYCGVVGYFCAILNGVTFETCDAESSCKYIFRSSKFYCFAEKFVALFLPFN